MSNVKCRDAQPASVGEAAWNPRYEIAVVTVLTLGFSLVGLDRFVIVPLFPTMAKALSLSYQDLGIITGALSVGWGLSALFMGHLADRIGHRKVLVWSVVIFSLLAGFSGAAVGIFSLIAIRVAMGLVEGSYVPASIVATIDASKPSRHGLNVGIQQLGLPLIGLGIAPIIVTQLLEVLDWRWIFAIVAVPGFVVALLLYLLIRDTRVATAVAHTAVRDTQDHRWSDVFSYRNIPLNMAGMLCWITVLTVLGALFPSYLIDYLHLNVAQMGFVLSALGFGGALGSLVMPAVSDHLGRKPVMVICVVGTAASLYVLSRIGPNSTQLFLALFASLFFLFTLITLTVGPVSAESVPAKLRTTASGIVIGTGELFGGAIAPVVAGFVAQKFGIQYILWLAMAAMGLGLIVSFSLEETVISKKTPKKAPNF